uniref:Receptor-like protein kinase FERONIA n=1 Tax=Rhizophora mucronata TaxID=61149 RepID=A0A2P2MV48_RHIMU
MCCFARTAAVLIWFRLSRSGLVRCCRYLSHNRELCYLEEHMEARFERQRR